MIRMTGRSRLLLCSALCVATFAAHAQSYPNRPIKIVVPYGAGGAVDIVARTVGQPLSDALKQPVIVENRPGASANIGMEAVAKAAPDGYTLLMGSNGIATNMALFPNLAFDGRRHFVAVARIGYAPLVIVVPASSPASCSSRRRRSTCCTSRTKAARRSRGEGHARAHRGGAQTNARRARASLGIRH